MLSSRTASPTNAPTHLELSSRALLNARRAFSSLLSFTKQWPIPKRTSAKKIKSSHLICQTTILLGFERKKCLNILFMNWKTPELISVQLCCKIFWCITNLVSLEVRPLSPTPLPRIMDTSLTTEQNTFNNTCIFPLFQYSWLYCTFHI